MVVSIVVLVAVVGYVVLNARQTVTSSRIGRFQIVMNPQVRADTFLVDTENGRIWQQVRYTDVKGEPLVWQYQERVDNAVELAAWVRRQLQ